MNTQSLLLQPHSVQPSPQGISAGEREQIYRYVLDLTNPEKRQVALLELSKKREEVPELAPILWYSFGTIAILLQEIISIYPLLSPPRLKVSQSNRVCNALALLQCVASHRETRTLFLNGKFKKIHCQFFSPFFVFVEYNPYI
jgi:CCR4-NOT transcription complex subunit 9